MSNPNFGAALANVEKIDGSISIEQLNDRGMIDLRGDASDKKFLAAVKKVLKIALPTTPRTSTSSDQISILWLSIDQWLIVCPLGETEKLLFDLKAGLGDIHSLAVDVSDARAIIALSGKGVREILMKGAPIDLTSSEFQVGTVRRMRFAEQAAMIHIVSENEDVIDLFVFRSYSVYVWGWLAATSKKAAHLEVFCEQEVAEI